MKRSTSSIPQPPRTPKTPRTPSTRGRKVHYELDKFNNNSNNNNNNNNLSPRASPRNESLSPHASMPVVSQVDRHEAKLLEEMALTENTQKALAQLDRDDFYVVHGVATRHARRFAASRRVVARSNVAGTIEEAIEESKNVVSVLAFCKQHKIRRRGGAGGGGAAAATQQMMRMASNSGAASGGDPNAAADAAVAGVWPSRDDFRNATAILMRFLVHKRHEKREQLKFHMIARVLRPALCAWVLRRRLRVQRYVKRWINFDNAKAEREFQRKLLQQQNIAGSASAASFRVQTPQKGGAGGAGGESLANVLGGASAAVAGGGASASSSLLESSVSAGAFLPSASMSVLGASMHVKTTAAHDDIPLTDDQRRVAVAAWLRDMTIEAVMHRRRWQKKHRNSIKAAEDWCAHHFGSTMCAPEALHRVGIGAPPPAGVTPTSTTFDVSKLRQIHLQMLQKEEEAADSAIRAAEEKAMDDKMAELRDTISNLRSQSITERAAAAMAAAMLAQRRTGGSGGGGRQASRGGGDGGGENENNDDDDENENDTKQKTSLAPLSEAFGRSDRAALSSIFELTQREQQTPRSPPGSGQQQRNRRQQSSSSQQQFRSGGASFAPQFTKSTFQSNNDQQQRKHSAAFFEDEDEHADQQQQQQDHEQEPVRFSETLCQPAPPHLFSEDKRQVPPEHVPYYLNELARSRAPKTGRGVDVLFDFSGVRRGGLGGRGARGGAGAGASSGVEESTRETVKENNNNKNNNYNDNRHQNQNQFSSAASSSSFAQGGNFEQATNQKEDEEEGKEIIDVCYDRERGVFDVVEFESREQQQQQQHQHQISQKHRGRHITKKRNLLHGTAFTGSLGGHGGKRGGDATAADFIHRCARPDHGRVLLHHHRHEDLYDDTDIDRYHIGDAARRHHEELQQQLVYPTPTPETARKPLFLRSEEEDIAATARVATRVPRSSQLPLISNARMQVAVNRTTLQSSVVKYKQRLRSLA